MSRLFSLCGLAALSAALHLTSPTAAANETKPQFDIDIVRTSIEELINIEVTTVSRQAEPYFRAPAAVHVLTAEQIARSGALTIPEALRLVPGVTVSRIDANKWAVSIRGFNSRTASKLLVLIDGRSVYNQLFSGVFWEAQDVLLEDIERIEVIRGPGGTLWGENAVNGVINIITKSAQQTQGAMVSAGVGNEDGFVHGRYGQQLSDKVFLRAFTKFLYRDDGYLSEGETFDQYDMFRAGFRSDYLKDEKSSGTLQGELYLAEAGEPFEGAGRDVDLTGGSLLARWKWAGAARTTEVLSYYDHYRYDSAALIEDRHTFDVELEQRWRYHPRHSLFWSLDYRITSDDIVNGPVISVDPSSRTDNMVAASLQEEFAVLPDTLVLTLGTKVGYNDYTGIEVQPNIRLMYAPAPAHTFWAAVSRAVRTPSRLEDDIVVAGTLTGNSSFRSEQLIAYEAGYRVRLYERVSFDLAAFFYDQERLLSIDDGLVGNNLHGDAYGGELAVNYVAARWLRFRGSYSYLQLELEPDANGLDAVRAVRQNGADPEHQFLLHAALEPAENWQVDFGVRYVDRLSSLDVASYAVADARVAWQAAKNVQVSLVGRNLFDKHHFEQAGAQATEVEQSVYGKLLLRY